MPPIVRNLRSLRSRSVRRRSTSGTGVRSFRRYSNDSGNNNGGLLSIVKNWGSKLKGFLSSALSKFGDKLRSISATDWLEKIRSAGEVIFSFNWQVTDAEIDSTIDAINNSVVERGFEEVGRTLGYAICGGGATAAITKFNPAMGAHVLAQVSEEAKQELLSSWSSALSQVGSSYAQAAALAFFKRWRAGLKNNPDYFISQFIRGIAGEEAFKKWGNPGNDEWTFTKGANDVLEFLVPNEWWREKVKAGLEAMGEACLEAGFVVAGAIDDWYGQQSYVRENLMGRDRIVEVIPDRSVPEESYILSGNENLLRPAISEIINQTRALNNRDMGTALVGADYEPIVTNNGIELTLEFFNYQHPPFWTKERRNNLARSRLTVPNCKRSKITWDNLKQTFGPNIAFQRGDFRMQANLQNGRQLVAWVDSKPEGEQLAEKMVGLTDTEIIFPLEFKERRKYPSNGRYRPKKREPQYLAFAHIVNIPRITKYEERRTLANRQEVDDEIIKSKYKAIMHFDRKPSWIDEQIAKVLKIN
ncbi:MAG: hypothetical protein SXA11_06960 [Cyanobacteriota bacterium]|nr:hypothetical protein [Cyanobacteriota bacterium]